MEGKAIGKCANFDVGESGVHVRYVPWMRFLTLLRLKYNIMGMVIGGGIG